MPGVLLCCLVHQARRGPPLPTTPTPDGVLLCISTSGTKGAPWVGSYSVVLSIRHLVAQPLYCSAADAGVWGERGLVMAPPSRCDSAVLPCFHGCSAFLHKHFPYQSPPSCPLDPSLHSQQKPLPWDCSTIPKLQLPATAPSMRLGSLSRVCMAVARTV